MAPDVHTAVQGPLPDAGCRADSSADREACAAAVGAVVAAACRRFGSSAWSGMKTQHNKGAQQADAQQGDKRQEGLCWHTQKGCQMRWKSS